LRLIRERQFEARRRAERILDDYESGSGQADLYRLVPGVGATPRSEVPFPHTRLAAYTTARNRHYARMDEHQRRTLRSMEDQVDQYRGGTLAVDHLATNLRGLMLAADFESSK
jgi:hypothetical protein